MIRGFARIACIGAQLVVFGSCSSVSYVVDWDTQHNFNGHQTYTWFERAPSPNRGQPPTEANSIVAGRISRSVNNALQSRGLEQAPAGEADLMATYFLVLQARTVMYHTGWAYPMAGWGWGPRWGWGGGWGGGRSSLETVTEGTLVIDILDGKSRKLVWRGVADRAFRKPNPSDEQVAGYIERLMRDFPPR